MKIDIEILNNLRKSTHGTISDIYLINGIIAAKKYHIPLEQYCVMVEFVFKRRVDKLNKKKIYEPIPRAATQR